MKKHRIILGDPKPFNGRVLRRPGAHYESGIIPQKDVRVIYLSVCPSILNTSIWSQISAWSRPWSMLGVNPAYCCSGWANLLHTCNPTEAGTLSYSVLFICALPGRERLRHCVCVCVCVCVHCTCVGGSDSLYQRQSATHGCLSASQRSEGKS